MVLREQEPEFPRVPITDNLAGDWEDGVFYPSDDGLPMGETEAHFEEILATVAKLRRWCEQRQRDFYVIGDMFYYWERGNPRAVAAPDILIARGIARQRRRKSYKLWHEHVVPAVAFEFLSYESQRRDLVEKPRLYERIGIPEYFLFDPFRDLMDPPLQGYRLAGTRYAHLFPDPDGWLLSEQLGIKFKADDDRLLLMDVATGEIILHPDDAATLARAEAEAERVRRAAAEAEAARVTAEAARASAEAEAMEAENARLRARLAELEGKQDDR